MNRSLVLILLLSVVSHNTFSQIIWSEDFQSYPAGTTVGGNNNIANPADDWTISCVGCNGTFETATAGGTSFFFASNLDAVGTWTSEEIDISGTGLAVVEIITGILAINNNGDFIRAYYTLDGGARTLFYEVLGNITIDVPATAILQGNSVVIEIEIFNNDAGFIFSDVHTFDNVTVTAITNLYSRQSSDLATSGTWSIDSYSGPNCGCTPGSTNIINIGDGHDVTMVADATVGAVNIENGSLSLNGAVNLNINYGSTLNIDAGSNLTTNNAGSQLNLLSFADYIFDLDGNLDVGIMNTDDSNTLTIQGGGSLNTRDDFLVSAEVNVTNSLNTLTIGDQLLYTAGDASFTNTGTIVINGSLEFTDDDDTFINDGTVTLIDALTVEATGFFASNDRNAFTNNGTANLEDIDPNNEDLIIINNSIINQTGAFTNGGIDGDTDITNATGATWNWSGTVYDGDVASNFDATASGNTFNYNASGAQPVISMTYDNITFSNSGTKATDGNIDVNGNLIITGSSVLDVDTGNDDITIAGDWTNNSSAGDSFDQGTETVTFDGATDQDILGSETFFDLTINKSNNVNLSSGVSVGGTLTLTNGFVNLGSNDLTILNTGTTSGGSSTSHVITSQNGELVQNNLGSGGRTGNVNFPIGRTSGSYTPVVINNGAGTADNFSVTVGNNVYEEGTFETGMLVTDEVVQKTWFISEATAGGSDATITLQWNGSDEGSMFDRTMIDVNNHDGAIWNAIEVGTAAAGGNPYTAQASNVSDFSPFAISGLSVLPVELTYFNAIMEGKNALVSWETASELNNDFFLIEKTIDGRNYRKVGIIEGQGTKGTPSSYKIYDEEPFSGRSYYRLTQVDYDGTATTFDPVAVDNLFDQWEVTVYPVPNRGETINVQIEGLDDIVDIDATVIDDQGRVIGVYPITLEPFQNGKAKFDFGTRLSSGIYTLVLGLPEPIARRILVK